MVESLNLAVIGGDGIGPEVTREALETLEVASSGKLDIHTTEYALGARHFLDTGEILGSETLERLATHDAIVLGAVGGDPRDSRLAGGIIERGLLLKLRFSFDHYVNLRPTALMPGVDSPLANPGSLDFVVVREGTEGPYVGNGGALRVGTPEEIANELSVNTAYGVERVVRFAFETARKRSKRLTLVHKTNVLVHAGALWSRVVTEVGGEYSDVEVDYLHIDAATIFMITQPERFDVIVTDNLFGDILTDLAGAVGGGIGLAASANLNPSGVFPSMFEPVHGSAPDIAGQGIADPTAAIMSMALMMDFLGHPDIAARIAASVKLNLFNGKNSDPRRTTGAIGNKIRLSL
ncbi:3-isopropylmalate dehydrogenase [Pontimonas sp.]|nr:3-isopropylmalate dehydrogenase [Pontimonas sp.]